MILNLYAVKDEKSGFDKVFASLNDAYAQREFSLAVKDSNSMFNHFPADYSLYSLGSFDTKDGSIVADLRQITSAVGVLGEV